MDSPVPVDAGNGTQKAKGRPLRKTRGMNCDIGFVGKFARTVLCFDKKSLEAVLRREKVAIEGGHWEDHPGFMLAVDLNKGKKRLYIVVLNMELVSDWNILTIYEILIHEAVHVWQYVCRHIGEDKPSAELEAYGISGIAQGLIEAYNEMTKKEPA